MLLMVWVPARVTTIDEASLPCLFSGVVSHRGGLPRRMEGYRDPISRWTSSGVALVGTPLRTKWVHLSLTKEPARGNPSAMRVSCRMPRYGS
jgi:hypothetical protein